MNEVAGLTPDLALDVVREQLEALAVAWRGGAPPAVVDAVLDAAMRLSAAAAVDSGDASFFVELDHARGRVEAGLAGLDRDERRSDLVECLELLDEIRRQVLDRVATGRGAPRAGAGSPSADLDASRSMLASVGVPRLHRGVRIDRLLLLPSDDELERALDQDDEDEDDDGDASSAQEVARRIADALEAPVPRKPRDEAYGERTLLDGLARSGLEDLASLSSLADGAEDAPWGDGERFEQRVLEALDALVSLDCPLEPTAAHAGIVDAAWAYATEWSVPDRGRTFALVFTLACLEEQSAARLLALAVRRSHPRTRGGLVSALARGSSPHIDSLVREVLATDDDAGRLLMALEVADRRAHVESAVVTPLLAHPEPRIAAAAARALAHVPTSRAALAEVIDGPAALVAAESLMVLGDPVGAKVAREHLLHFLDARDAPAIWSAAELVALLGEARDAEVLQRVAREHRRGVVWLGWHGWTHHVDLLVERLERADDPEVRHDAAEALHRLSGAGYGGTAPQRTPPQVTPLELDPGRWSQLVAGARRREGAREPAARLRFGRAAGPSACLDELEDPRALRGDRRRASRELWIATRRRGPLDVDGWAAGQRNELAAMRSGAGQQA